MGLIKVSWIDQNFIQFVFLLCWVFSVLCFVVQCDVGSKVSVKFLKAPRVFSHLNSATFEFQVFVGGNGSCTSCITSCKLDGNTTSDCEANRVFYSGLQEGDHTFEVCTNGFGGVGCANYNWTIDTIPPTAYVSTPTPFTNALNFSVNISFTEPCRGRGGFQCSSVKACNLLVYGAGLVIPSSLTVLQQDLRYSLIVGLSPSVQYGRVVLVMDKNFCTDRAGNIFQREANSSFNVHYDRREVFVNLRTHVPEKLLKLNSQTRTVQATNNHDNLKVYLYFSEQVLNSSMEIQRSLSTSQGVFLPIMGKTQGNRRFGFLVANTSTTAIITVSLDSSSIISRQGTPISPIAPVTFLYDSERPTVRLLTRDSKRTRETLISIYIKFMKPVFGFNSSFLTISGGYIKSLQEVSWSLYEAKIQAHDDTVVVNVPENVTGDVSGNQNLASNVLHVRHYSVPTISSIISTFTTAAFLVVCSSAGLLTLSTASLQSIGAFSRPHPYLTSHPAKNLFRIASHIQFFALTRWLAVTIPVEYYEFTRGLHWIIPYFRLPWETRQMQSAMMDSENPVSQHSYVSKIHDIGFVHGVDSSSEYSSKASLVYGLPLTPMEYRSFFESPDVKPEAESIFDPQSGWRDFNRIMFWLALIGGSLLLLHGLIFLILKFRKNSSKKKIRYGSLVFPRFQIFLIILVLPSIAKASADLVRGGNTSGTIVGSLLLSVVAFLLLALLLFLSVAITLGKLLQYKEVHQEGQEFHWYQDLVRVTLGPGKRGQWTWKNKPKSVYLTMLGPLFEDLRGPPKYMVSQISGGNIGTRGDHIIPSDDENEDAEAPIIQKLFGILRIYYTLLEVMKRVSLGIVAGIYFEDWSSKTPIIVLLSITAFQLFFLVLKKPFIKKKVQLVEIISVSSEVGILATFLVLLAKDFSSGSETKVGIFMLILFLVGFSSQMINESYALYRQTKQLDPNNNSFVLGLKMASIGFLLYFIPHKFAKNFQSRFPVGRQGDGETGEAGSSTERTKSSGSRNSGYTDRPWHKQLRELAKASFSRDGGGAPNDPSSSNTTRWSGIWSLKKSESSSLKSSSDSKPKGLYKDLEAIFAAK